MTPFGIATPGERKSLDPTPSPHFAPLTPSLHIGYRKGVNISRWVLRRRIAGRYYTHTFRDIIPDDDLPADGKRVLSFQQIKSRVLAMALTDDERPFPRLCTFCRKGEHEVAALVAGQDGFICDSCIDIGHAIVEEFRRNPDRDWSNWRPES